MPELLRRLNTLAFLLMLVISGGGVRVALAAVPAAPQTAEALAKDWLLSKGWHEGFDQQARRMVFLQTASISVKPSDPTYLRARQASFERALADARTAAAKFLSAEVESRLASNNSVVEVLGDKELAEALTGVASNDAFKGSSELSEVIGVVAEASLAGLYACETFESTGDPADSSSLPTIAVVAALGPNSAAAVRGNSVMASACESKQLGAWFDAIPDDVLARTWGVRFQADERCALRPVSFGQARVRPGALGMDGAVREAAQTAEGQLTDLLGQGVAARALSESVSRFDESTGIPPSFRSMSNYRDSVRTAAKNSFGIERVSRRTVIDPATGEKLVVVAVTIPAPTASATPASKAPAAAPAGAARSGGCPPVPPEMASSIRQTQAAGTGPTKAAALESALLEAVRREGASVKGNSVLERQFSEAMKSADGDVHEIVSSRVDQSSKVETFSKGFVHSYEVIKESKEDSLWEVSVCANLVRFDPKNPRFGLPPTVAVLPFACTAGTVRVAGSAASCDEATSPCEHGMEAVIAPVKSFMLLGERDQPKLRQVRDDIEQRVASGRSEEIEAVKLGRELTADFIVTGKVVRAEFTGPAGQQPQGVQASHNATAVVEARMVNVSSGEVVWSKSVTVSLMGRDILLVRAGRNMKDPSEQALSPLQLAVSRAAGELAESLAKAFPAKAAAPTATAVPVSLKVLRVANGMVTLDASNPAVVVGAKFIVNMLTEIPLAGGRIEIDRDPVASIEVTSVNGGLAKARAVSGDASAIDPSKCEVVPVSK